MEKKVILLVVFLLFLHFNVHSQETTVDFSTTVVQEVPIASASQPGIQSTESSVTEEQTSQAPEPDTLQQNQLTVEEIAEEPSGEIKNEEQVTSESPLINDQVEASSDKTESTEAPVSNELTEQSANAQEAQNTTETSIEGDSQSTISTLQPDGQTGLSFNQVNTAELLNDKTISNLRVDEDPIDGMKAKTSEMDLSQNANSTQINVTSIDSSYNPTPVAQQSTSSKTQLGLGFGLGFGIPFFSLLGGFLLYRNKREHIHGGVDYCYFFILGMVMGALVLPLVIYFFVIIDKGCK